VSSLLSLLGGGKVSLVHPRFCSLAPIPCRSLDPYWEANWPGSLGGFLRSTHRFAAGVEAARR
jgi:hypothetical protein